jgi:hypothetical protein
MFHIMMIHKLRHDYVFQSMLDLENCVNRMKERGNGNFVWRQNLFPLGHFDQNERDKVPTNIITISNSLSTYLRYLITYLPRTSILVLQSTKTLPGFSIPKNRCVIVIYWYKICMIVMMWFFLLFWVQRL